MICGQRLVEREGMVKEEEEGDRGEEEVGRRGERGTHLLCIVVVLLSSFYCCSL